MSVQGDRATGWSSLGRHQGSRLGDRGATLGSSPERQGSDRGATGDDPRVKKRSSKRAHVTERRATGIRATGRQGGRRLGDTRVVAWATGERHQGRRLGDRGATGERQGMSHGCALMNGSQKRWRASLAKPSPPYKHLCEMSLTPWFETLHHLPLVLRRTLNLQTRSP